MTKPFDVKNLEARLKAKGLDAAEELVKLAASEIFDWTQESVMIHPNPFVKFAAPIVAQVKQIALEEIDKIDGQKG